MKWLIYSLIVINLGVAAWHYRGGDSRQDGVIAEAGDQDGQQLVLLREHRAQQEKEKAAKVAPARLCYGLGPFENSEHAKQAQQVLKQQGISAQSVTLRDTSRDGYWVVIPPATDRETARRSLEELKGKGVKDYFLVATGQHENAISLGVFSKQEHAERRINDINSMGFSPVIESVKLPRKVYWLEWPKSSDKSLSQANLAELNQKFEALSQIERSCK